MNNINPFKDGTLVEKMKKYKDLANEFLSSKDCENFIHFILKKYIRMNKRNIFFEDIVSCAYIGMYKAILRYDYKRGIKFSTFASQIIIGEAKLFLRENTLNGKKNEFKLPRGMKEAYIALNNYSKNKLIDMYDITEKEALKLAKENKINKDTMLKTLKLRDTIIIHLDADYESDKGSDDDNNMLTSSKIKDDKNYYNDVEFIVAINKLFNSFIEQVEDRLTKKAYKIFFNNIINDIYMNQTEVGKMIGISQVRVSRLYSQFKKSFSDFLQQKDVYKFEKPLKKAN